MPDSRPDNAGFRILDANFNRARESLRVMEEYARFVMDDAGLTSAFKELRHELSRLADQAVARAEARGSAIGFRDTVGDVGCDITTPTESQRNSTEDVVIAAGKRLSEALRVLEEYGKIIDADLGCAVERLRYRGYELERRLALTIEARRRFGDVRLYLLLTAELCHHDWLTTAQEAVRGGVDCIQLREKTLSDRELHDRARKLVDRCRPHGVMVIINDRPDIAVAVHADGVHVGQDDLPLAAVRRIVPPTMVVGVSTHTPEQARSAAQQAPDYIAVGPMYDSPTKPQAHLAGPKALAEVRRSTSLPLVAIGGIREDNVDSVLAAGATCVCVCHAVLGQPDVQDAVRRIRERMDALRPPR